VLASPRFATAVDESQESWEQFRDGMLMPHIQAGIEGGFPAPPEAIAIDVYKLFAVGPQARGPLSRTVMPDSHHVARWVAKRCHPQLLLGKRRAQHFATVGGYPFECVVDVVDVDIRKQSCLT
jgi:hypothetical protein